MEQIPALIQQLEIMLTSINPDFKFVEVPSPQQWAKPLSYAVNEKGDVISLNLKGIGLRELVINKEWEHIQRLDISSNDFTTLSFEMDLPALELLEISYNKRPLEKLIFNTAFGALKYLYVYDSKLRGIDFKQGLPPALLADDSNLNLGKNELAGDLKDILAEEDVAERRKRLQYYFKQPITYVKRVKLVLLGNTNTGKTTLHNLLAKTPRTTKSTHGINVFDFTTKTTVVTVKGFDFGGQDYYHNTHFSFFGSNALYILLWGRGQADGWHTTPRDGKEERIYPRSYWLGAVDYYMKQAAEGTGAAKETEIHKTVMQAVAATQAGVPATANGSERVHLHLLQNLQEGKQKEVAWLNQQELKTTYTFIEGYHHYCLKTNNKTQKDKIRKWVDEVVDTFAIAQGYPENGNKLAGIINSYPKVLIPVNELKTLAYNAGIPRDDGAFTALLQGLHALLDCYYLAPATLQKKSMELLDKQQDEPVALTGEQHRLSSYVIRDLEAFTNWLYWILAPKVLHNGYFTKQDAISRLAAKAITEEETGFVLDFMLYHKIIFKVRTEPKYIAPNYLPATMSNAEALFLQTFEPALVQYEFKGFFHASILTEILAKFIAHKVPVGHENKTGLRFVLWKNKVLLCEEDTEADKPLHQNKLLLLDFEPIPKTAQKKEAAEKTMDNEHGAQKEKEKPKPGDALPVIRLHRFAKSKVKDAFIREVMEEIETIINGYDYTKWVITPAQHYIPFDCLEEDKQMTEQGKKTGLVQHEGKIYRRGDFKLFIKNPGDLPMKKIFISYSKDDLTLVNQFEKHLAPLQRNNIIESWYCTKLVAGSDWDATIQAQFEAADIICFMVSPNFNATDYIYEYELKKAFKRKQNDPDFKIVPIILKYCIWTSANEYNLGKYTALPYIGKPIMDFNDPDMAWLIVVEGLKILCEHFNDIDPQGEDYYHGLVAANPVKLSKQLLRFFERIVEGKVDNNS
jgi:internalin A